MPELVIAAVAALLITAGLLVLASPSIRPTIRAIRALARHMQEQPSPVAPQAGTLPAPIAQLSPTTQRIIVCIGRTAGLLNAQGNENAALELRRVGRQIAVDEESGLTELRRLLQRFQNIRLEDESMHLRYRRLYVDLTAGLK